VEEFLVKMVQKMKLENSQLSQSHRPIYQSIADQLRQGISQKEMKEMIEVSNSKLEAFLIKANT